MYLSPEQLGVGLAPIPRIAAPRSPHHHPVRTLLKAGKCLHRKEAREGGRYRGCKSLAKIGDDHVPFAANA